MDIGLQQEVIRNRVHPYLVLPKPTDSEDDFQKVNDDLLIQINLATAEEKQRANKFQNNSTRKRVSSTVAATKVSGLTEHKESHHLVALLQKLEAQLGSLTVEVNNLKAGADRYPSVVRRRCDMCVREDKSFCEHCYKCGSTDHFARGCKQVSNDSRHRP